MQQGAEFFRRTAFPGGFHADKQKGRGQRNQFLEKRPGVLVGEGTVDEVELFTGIDLPQRVGQSPGAFRVVRAVEKQFFMRKHLEPGGPVCLPEAVERFLRIEPEPCGKVQQDQPRQRRVRPLETAGQGQPDGSVPENLIRNIVFENDASVVGHDRLFEGSLQFPAPGFENAHGFIGNGASDKDRHARLDDPRLLESDLGESVAEVFLVFQREGGDDAGQRRDDVCGVQTPSHAGLPDHEVCPRFREQQRGGRGGRFEVGDAESFFQELFRGGADFLQRPGDRDGIRNGAVDAEPFVHLDQVGRGIEPGFESGVEKPGFQEGAGGTFAVAPRDMDELQIFPGRAQFRKKRPRLVQTELHPEEFKSGQPGEDIRPWRNHFQYRIGDQLAPLHLDFPLMSTRDLLVRVSTT
ncbi:MAG: hypothetical protein BWY31_00816 [Lentisphaerae bacterium ADurb.Bin242]|nr:MAG: hypothetical protein BWY31_00816 [Lentisphaerae bacterium ADurb.Bin242]